MKIHKKRHISPMGDYLLAVALGLFLGTIADIVTQSLVKSLFSNVLACRIAEFLVCLLILAGSICVTSGRIAYKQKRKDMLTTMLALIPVLVLQLILAFVFQFVSYISGCWLLAGCAVLSRWQRQCDVYGHTAGIFPAGYDCVYGCVLCDCLCGTARRI